MNEHIDIEVKRMSKESIEMLNNLSAVCKRYGINYYRATQEMRVIGIPTSAAFKISFLNLSTSVKGVTYPIIFPSSLRYSM